MAGQLSSSSSSTNNVIISYFGDENSRTGFADYLWKALHDKGINTFIDDQEDVVKGNEISQELSNLIQESRIAVILFSDRYVSSTYCLDELSCIVDNLYKNHAYRFILPIFNYIDPFSVREQSGRYAEAFAIHEEKFKDNKEKVLKWRNALSHVANLSDKHFIHRDVDETELIDQIVRVVSEKLDRVPLHIATWHKVSNWVSQTFQNSKRFFNDNIIFIWRLVGTLSCFIGLLCYAGSPSFDRLTGRINKVLVISLYVAFFIGIFITIWVAREISLSTQYDQLIKTCKIFLVLLIISVYSFFYDRAVDGKPDILSVVSNAAFAFVSLSLHKLFKLKSEMGVFSYFLCCFTVQLLTINGGLIIVAIIFGFLLSYIHSSPNFATGRQDSLRSVGGSGGQHVVGFES